MNRATLQNLRSNTDGKKPQSEDMLYGEIAINYKKGSESLFIKNDSDEIVKIETDLSNTIDFETFEPISQLSLNFIQKGSLGKINGQSLEDNDVDIDLTLYRFAKTLPTENILDNKIYLIPSSVSGDSNNNFDEYLYDSEKNNWEKIGSYNGNINLDGYLKTVDADKKYVQKSTNTNANMNVDNKGALANFSDNGQAYLAVRPKTAKFLINSPYVGAAFGVKDDGTAAFSHKTYATYDDKTGNYTSARNTAVFQFAGPTGLRYAKNEGTASDVTDAMYHYVGVIDSPDDFQRVYSAKQVDDLLKTYTDQIAKLTNAIIELGGTIE